MKTTSLSFIPGWGSSTSVWTPLIGQLYGTRPIRLLDLPGQGDTPAASGATLANWAEALASRLDGPTVLCGWSLGAMIALQLALQRPQLVEALVLIAPTPRFVACEDWPHGLEPNTVDRFRSGFSSDSEAILRRFAALQAMGDDHRHAVKRELEAARLPHNEDCDQALAQGLAVLSVSDLRADVLTLDIPARILHGDGDALMPLPAALWLADHLPSARLSVLEGCGHAPLLSRPLECATLIESFLDD